jgi:hypothetical protein
MHTNTQALLTNSLLKVLSFLMGLVLWSILGDLFYVKHTVTIPLYFYQKPLEAPLPKSPDHIMVTLYGKRADLRSINFHELALHIDYAALRSGINVIQPTHHNLFLPPFIKVISYKPINLTITKLDT